MDERSFRWFRASVILSGLTIIVVLANSATNYERRSTETEEIANLQTRMKVLEDQHQTDQE